ncbi:MAG: hypothetical protein K0S32_3541 [Bacteroidetes bacterium]|jgi:hypothetical protein|nr:hypothetical protein [Bacteroidota bacterium]
MIRKFILPLIAIVLLSSCANKFSIVKRKYNKGYHVDVSHKKTTDPKNDNLTAVKNKKQTKSSSEEPVASEVASTFSSVDNEIKVLPSATVLKPENKTTNPSKHTPLASAEKKKDYSKNSFRPVALKQSNKQTSKDKPDDDVMFIIMIILCFFPFINLISVYLKDDKDVTLNFWITLILDILFFLPGIIFALLVVLDVVNLNK